VTTRSKFRRALPSPTQLAVFALIAGTSAVHAQGAAPVAVAAASAPGARADGKAPDDGTLQQVIVTATKRETSLQDTPIAITNLSSDELDKHNVQTLVDVVHLVPSFQATTQGDHGVITMTLRGIGNDSAKTEYADPEVAMFVDNIYSPRAEGAAVLLFDMDHIEVLRGPQGTLWGRNSTAGAVNMQTAKPELGENFGDIQGGVGDYNRLGTRAAFNFALGDTTALRAAFVHEQHDGYVKYQQAPHLSLADQQAAAEPTITAWNTANPNNPIAFQPINPNLFTQQGQRYDAQDQSAARLSLLWKPEHEVTLNLSYEKFLDRGTPNMNLLQTPRPGTDFWSALIDTAPQLHRDVNTFRGRLDWALSDSMNLAVIAGYSDFHGESDFDQDGGATVPTSFTSGAKFQEDRTNYSHYKNYSTEVELQSVGKREIDWIVGAYYEAENNAIRFDIPIMNGTQQGTVNWQGSFIQPKETVQTEALFGQATWNVSDALHLTGGARYTWDERKNEGGTNNGWTYDPTVAQVPIDPGLNPLDPGSGFSTYQHNDGKYTNSKPTWLGRVSYDVSKDFMTYASIATGYKSGGLQDGGRPYGPETLISYEAGTKNTFAGNTIQWNNAIYYEDFKDFQFSAPVTNPDGTHSLATSNAEGAKVYGLESELAANVTRDDKVQVAFSYLHTELGHLIAGSNDYALPPCTVPNISTCLDVTGHELPHSPSTALQVNYEHAFRFADGSRLSPRIAFHYESSSWLSVFNLGDPDQQKSYTRTDLGLRYQAAKQWWVDAYVQNVEDGKIKTSAQNGFGPWQAQYLPPRTFGVNVGISF
jgi:iron complex outermembrane receptor protein